jgi:hypothetical protein
MHISYVYVCDSYSRLFHRHDTRVETRETAMLSNSHEDGKTSIGVDGGLGRRAVALFGLTDNVATS